MRLTIAPSLVESSGEGKPEQTAKQARKKKKRRQMSPNVKKSSLADKTFFAEEADRFTRWREEQGKKKKMEDKKLKSPVSWPLTGSTFLTLFRGWLGCAFVSMPFGFYESGYLWASLVSRSSVIGCSFSSPHHPKWPSVHLFGRIAVCILRPARCGVTVYARRSGCLVCRFERGCVWRARVHGG